MLIVLIILIPSIPLLVKSGPQESKVNLSPEDHSPTPPWLIMIMIASLSGENPYVIFSHHDQLRIDFHHGETQTWSLIMFASHSGEKPCVILLIIDHVCVSQAPVHCESRLCPVSDPDRQGPHSSEQTEPWIRHLSHIVCIHKIISPFFLVESWSWRDWNLKFGPNCDLEVDNFFLKIFHLQITICGPNFKFRSCQLLLSV